MKLQAANATLLKDERSVSRATLVLSLLTVLVFLSRVPFLSTGLGVDPDGWRIVNVAHDIAATGEYSASRLPGFPLPEFAYSLLRTHDPFVLNGATALLSSLAFLFFALSLRELGSRNYILPALAMVCTPVIYINSTTSMDYLWALSCILGSFHSALRRRPLLAGALLGFAAGSRITSLMFAVPLCLVVYHVMNNRLKNVFAFCVTASIVSVMMFFPVLQKYGLSFLSYHDSGYPDILAVVYRAGPAVWGVVGLAAIAVALLVQLRDRPRFSDQPAISMGKEMSVAILTAVSLCLILYVGIPYEAGYLIPAVPFAILLLGSILQQRHFAMLCVVLIVSPFFLSLDSEGVHLQGPVFRDQERRKDRSDLVRNVISAGNDLSSESVIVAGPYLPQIHATLAYDSLEIRKYVYLLDATELQHFIDRGFKVYYVPEMNDYNFEIYGVKLDDRGRPIIF